MFLSVWNWRVGRPESMATQDLRVSIFMSQILPACTNNDMDGRDIVTFLLVKVTHSLVGVFMSPQSEINTVILRYGEITEGTVNMMT